MAEPVPVAVPTPTPDAAVAQVRQALVGVLGPDANAPAVEDAAREVVAELWDRPVRVFVAVLAARAVRDLLVPVPSSRPVSGASVASPRPGLLDELMFDPRDDIVTDPREDLIVDPRDGLIPD